MIEHLGNAHLTLLSALTSRQLSTPLQVLFDIAPPQGIDRIVILAASLPVLMVPAYRIYRSPDESDIG